MWYAAARSSVVLSLVRGQHETARFHRPSLLAVRRASGRSQRAQQRRATRVIGFLHATSLETRRAEVSAFHRGLTETGHVEGV
jgi:hypothetical protein